MDNIVVFKELKVILPRLPEFVVENYFERYEKIKDDLEDLIENEDMIDEEEDEFNQNTPPAINTYLHETGLNVSLIAKNDKKLVKLNLNGNSVSSKGNILTENVFKMNTNEENDVLMSNTFEDTNNDDTKTIRIATITKTDDVDSTPSKTTSLCYQCNKCSKLFTHKLQLKSHMAQHKNSPSSSTSSSKIICNECGKQLNSQSDFNRHLQMAHNAVKPYKCSICAMAFFDVSSKNRHEKEHSGLKPYRCYICGFEFTRASNLRSHLIKLHSSEIGKSVIISKTPDNKLKFDFDLDAINLYREQQKLNKSRANDNATAAPPTNAVIYIKDPNNKSSDIQYMVVYVDGKPIFVQNPKGANNLPQQIQQQLQATNKIQPVHSQQNIQQNENSKVVRNVLQNTNLEMRQIKATKIKSINQTTTTTAATQSQQNQQITKIPHLLAAAAAAAASSSSSSSNRCTLQTVKKDKNDHEYQHLVSLFKQKNEKLFNPLSNPLPIAHTDVPVLTNTQNNSVCL